MEWNVLASRHWGVGQLAGENISNDTEHYEEKQPC